MLLFVGCRNDLHSDLHRIQLSLRQLYRVRQIVRDLEGLAAALALHADNLLNRRYYDHTSYYRLIDVPEPGRNVSLMVGLEF